MPDDEIRDANLRLLLLIPRFLSLADEIREQHSLLMALIRKKADPAFFPPSRGHAR